MKSLHRFAAAFTLILLIGLLGIINACADSEVGLFGNVIGNDNGIRYHNNTVSFTVFLPIDGRGNTISRLIVETTATDNLRFLKVECIKDDGNKGIMVPITKAYDGHTLDLSDITFTTGTYYFIFSYQILSTRTEFIRLNCKVKQYSLYAPTHVVDIMKLDCNMGDLYISQAKNPQADAGASVPQTGDAFKPLAYILLATASAAVLRRAYSVL